MALPLCYSRNRYYLKKRKENPLLTVITTINQKETRVGLNITNVVFQENQEVFRFETSFLNIMTWMYEACKNHTPLASPCCHFLHYFKQMHVQLWWLLFPGWSTKLPACKTKQNNPYNVRQISWGNEPILNIIPAIISKEFHEWKVPFPPTLPSVPSVPSTKSSPNDHLPNCFPALPAHCHLSFKCLYALGPLPEVLI